MTPTKRSGRPVNLPGLVLTDHRVTVPLHHDAPDGPTLTVFAREAVAPRRRHDDLPWLVFLQGGPGHAAPRPTEASGWLARALRDHRVLLLDQRGTGLSTPITRRTLEAHGSPEAQARFLGAFRADAIVRDVDVVCRTIAGDRRVGLLGQSFGGFCAVHALSAIPDRLDKVVITGGLPPLEARADDVYRATYARVLAKNADYFARYPRDADLARRIATELEQRDVRLPNGDRLSRRRFQQLGLAFGASDGFEEVHHLLELAYVEGDDRLAEPFLHGVQVSQTFEQCPIFAFLHEAIYAQGEATRWAAHRVRDEFGAFDPGPDDPLLFTGEMIYPWMFDEYDGLRPFAAAAELLAQRDDWPHLYDVERLSSNQVPTAAAVYTHDMYVERDFSEQTAATIGARIWMTNEYEHNGLRADGERVLDRLLGLIA